MTSPTGPLRTIRGNPPCLKSKSLYCFLYLLEIYVLAKLIYIIPEFLHNDSKTDIFDMFCFFCPGNVRNLGEIMIFQTQTFIFIHCSLSECPVDGSIWPIALYDTTIKRRRRRRSRTNAEFVADGRFSLSWIYKSRVGLTMTGVECFIELMNERLLLNKYSEF